MLGLQWIIYTYCKNIIMVGMKHLSLFLLDVKNTFLDDDLEEDIYMKQLLNLLLGNGEYGLKTSPRI